MKISRPVVRVSVEEEVGEEQEDTYEGEEQETQDEQDDEVLVIGEDHGSSGGDLEEGDGRGGGSGQGEGEDGI